MSTQLTTLAHSIRPFLAERGINLSLGHTQQLVAATFGYQSLAALQAADEPTDLDSSLFFVIDESQLGSRARSLSLQLDQATFISCLANVSRRLDGPKVYTSMAALADDLAMEVQTFAEDDDSVGSCMADTNCTGPFMGYMEVSSSVTGPLPPKGEDITFDFDGTVEADPDIDRPFSGDTVNVTAEARMEVRGRRLLGPLSIEISCAQLDWSWAASADDEMDEGDVYGDTSSE